MDGVRVDIGDDVGDGLRFPAPDAAPSPPDDAKAVKKGGVTRKGGAPPVLGAGTYQHASRWSRQEEKGTVSVKYAGEWSFHKRYIVYSSMDTTLRITRRMMTPAHAAREAADYHDLPDQGPPGGHTAIRTHEGETLTCRVTNDADAGRWLGTLSSAQESPSWVCLHQPR